MASELMETHQFILIKSFSINALEFKMKETRSVTNQVFVFSFPEHLFSLRPCQY